MIVFAATLGGLFAVGVTTFDAVLLRVGLFFCASA
jgi:hypothetical protein